MARQYIVGSPGGPVCVDDTGTRQYISAPGVYLNETTTAVAADNPPFTNRGRVAVLATIVALCQPPAPSPHIGGRQPIEPAKLNPSITAVQVDDPPFTQRERTPQRVAVVAQSQPPAWTYTFFGGFAPYVPEYCAAFAVAVDNPPFVHRERTLSHIALLAQCQPERWVYSFQGGAQPYDYRKLPQGQAVFDPPFTLGGPYALPAELVAAAQPNAWTYTFAGGLQPFAPRRLTPSVLAVAVDNPPFENRGRTAALNSILAAHQPDPWRFNYLGPAGGLQPYGPRQLNPSITAVRVDDPPFCHPERGAAFATIKASWRPDPWTYTFSGGRQPFEGRKLTPGIPGQSVDNPPFRYAGPVVLLAQAVALNQPEAWPYNFPGGLQVYTPRKLSPGVPGQSVDKPPFTLGGPIALPAEIVSLAQPAAWPYTFAGAKQPYAPRLLNPSITAVAVNDPPFTYGGPIAVPASVIAGNQPAAWPYSFIGGAQPYAPSRLSAGILGVTNDNPPFQEGGPVAIEAAIVGASQPDPWSYRYLGPAGGLQPYGPRQLNPALLAVQVDDPPFSRRQALDRASWWLPDPPLPQQSPKLVQPFTADTVPSSRPWLPAILAAWADPAPPPQQRGALSPGIPGQSVDNPPFVHRERTLAHTAIVAACQPNPWTYSFQGGAQPYDYRKLPQGQSVFDPPFTLGGPYAIPAELVAAAQPSAWAYTFAGGLQPFAPRRLTPSVIAVAVDNPPFDRRSLELRIEIVALWQPVTDRAPILPEYGIPESGLAPVVVEPPAGGGKRKKPVRPIWDREEQPAPEIVESEPATSAPERPAKPVKPVKPAPLRSFDGLAQALTPPAPVPAPQAEVPALERRRLARLDLVEASDRTAVVEQDDHVTAKASVEASAELRHTEPDDQLSAVGFVAIAASLRHHDDDDKLVALVVHETSDDIENDDEEVIALLLQQL